MKKAILSAIAVLFVLSFAAKAQVYDGLPLDSTMIRFTGGTIPGFIADTATIPLWQIGRTHKTYFTSDTAGYVTMMTDTVNYYPSHANNWFVFKLQKGFNTIIDFWHKYQTDSMHAGGIIEFSIDHGMVWQNVKGACSADSSIGMQGVYTTNFYTFNDTLLTGAPSFMGSGTGQRYSRFQFFDALPAKGTIGGCPWWSVDTFYIRFRFVSDSATDTLAGWAIDSIKVEQDYYGGSVARISTGDPLQAFPNPSTDGLFTFPALADEEQFSIEVYNAMGQKILKEPYRHSLDLSHYATGIYFYRVSDGAEYYSGRLQTE